MPSDVARYEVCDGGLEIKYPNGQVWPFSAYIITDELNRIAIMVTDYERVEADRDRWHRAAMKAMSSPDKARLIYELEAAVSQLRHDRECLVENLRDVRDAVWRTSMNATLSRFQAEELARVEEDSALTNVCLKCGGDGGGHDAIPTCSVCGGTGEETTNAE